MLAFSCFHVKAQKKNLYDSIMENVRIAQKINIRNLTGLDFANNDIADFSKLDAIASDFSQKIDSEGKFGDIDYSSRLTTAWPPSQHLVRLHFMTLAYTSQESKLYGNSTLFQQIENGLEFWWKKDPRSTNWWNQQIFCPKQIGEMLILLRVGKQTINKNLETNLLSRMAEIGGEPNGRYSEGGSNRINISAHWIYRGCLTKDKSVLEEGIKNALLPIRFSPPAGGLRNDFSYQEHGPQLYIGNYGYAFVENVSNIALYLKNTTYELSDEQLGLVSTFVRDTYIPVIRGKYYSFSIPGRQIANKNNLDRSKTTNILEKMRLIDPTNKEYYHSAFERWNGTQDPSYGVTPMHRQYWLSDYTAHVRPSYFIDVRYVSDRTLRTENVNREDKKGFFLSEGATNMTIKGDEYFNVFGVWNWTKVPGTTAPQIDSLPDLKINDGKDSGIESFCGGVSDSIYGVSSYVMNNVKFKVQAKKSWFFFDKEIVCLGADIESTSDNDINTTINQCRSEGAVTFGRKNKVESFKALFEEKKPNDLDWVLHGGFGYYFPNGGNIAVANKTQYGNWRTISVSQEDKKVEGNIFSLWFDHGTTPKDQKYAYYIVPNMQTSAQMKKYIKSKTIEILSNEASSQVVYQKDLKILQAVFYNANQSAEVKGDFKIETNVPCILMARKNGSKMDLHVTDPTQKLKTIIVRIKDYKTGHSKEVEIELATGIQAGLSAKKSIEL